MANARRLNDLGVLMQREPETGMTHLDGLLSYPNFTPDTSSAKQEEYR